MKATTAIGLAVIAGVMGSGMLPDAEAPKSWTPTVARVVETPRPQERPPLGNITTEEMATLRSKIAYAERTKSWPSENVRLLVAMCLDAPYLKHCETWRR